MNLIYIMTESGEQQAYEDVQVYDMLEQAILSSETPYWREGMTEWRPLSELPPRKGAIIAPARRPPGPTNPFASLKGAAMPPERDLSDRARKRKAYRRFFFRINPVPLTLSIQIVTVMALVLWGVFTYLCLDKIFGWNGGAMTDLLSTASPGVNISSDDRIFFLEFLAGLLLAHVVIEIMFFNWVYFANKNSRAFATNIRFQPDWAVQCFFIPVVNLFRPYQIMQEIWKVSENPRSWIGRRDSIYVGFWFLVRWSILGLAWSAYVAFYSNMEDANLRAQQFVIFLATVAADIALIEIVTVILISIVTWRQRKWVRSVESAAP